MNAANTFRIQRLGLDVEFNGPEAAGLAFQSRLSEWCSAWLAGALEQALKNYAPDQELHWALDRLDLQIDDLIAPDQLEEKLPALLQSALESALREARAPHPAPGNAVVIGKNQIAAPANPGSQMKTAAQNTWDAFCHFLRTGWLPWSFRLPGGHSLETAVRAVWQERGERAALTEALRKTLQARESRQRLVRQFSQAWVEEIAAILAPGQTVTIRQIIRLLHRESNAVPALRPAENRLWEIALAQGAGGRSAYSVAELMQDLFTESLPGESMDLLRETAVHLTRSPRDEKPDVPAGVRRALQFALQDWLESFRSDAPGGLGANAADSSDAFKSSDESGQTAFQDNSSDDSGSNVVNLRPRRGPTFVELKFGKIVRASERPNVNTIFSAFHAKTTNVRPLRGHETYREPTSSTNVGPLRGIKLTTLDSGSSNASEQMATSTLPADYLAEGIYIENSGLVLLHPFIPLFFETLGVVKDEKIVDPDKALALLHFLASGETTAPEHELVLPKILCGLPPDTVAGPAVLLNENDMSESINLLETAIGYWEALKNTSPDGLRDTFLRRPGKISRRDADWLLQVERQSFDILLDDLPWGLSVLQFPWMAELVWVEW